MQTEISRLNLVQEYELAPDNTLFKQQTIAAVLNCSLATLEHGRWAGSGIPFLKVGHLVRYRKADVQHWLSERQPVQSTTQAQLNTRASALSEGV